MNNKFTPDVLTELGFKKENFYGVMVWFLELHNRYLLIEYDEVKKVFSLTENYPRNIQEEPVELNISTIEELKIFIKVLRGRMNTITHQFVGGHKRKSYKSFTEDYYRQNLLNLIRDDSGNVWSCRDCTAYSDISPEDIKHNDDCTYLDALNYFIDKGLEIPKPVYKHLGDGN
jgi:hypothetical protein